MTEGYRSRLFIRNFLLFLVPLFFPLVILGSFSIVIAQKYFKDEIDRMAVQSLHQTQQNVELLLAEMDALNLNFGTNPEISFGLKRILRSKAEMLGVDEITKLVMIGNFFDTSANSRPYIHSIYVYMDNDNGQFLATSHGLANFRDYWDIEWFSRQRDQEPGSVMWSEIRYLRQYDYEPRWVKVLSIYRRLFTSGGDRSDGLVVLNIHANYIEGKLEELRIYPKQRISIYDSAGVLLFGSVPGDPGRVDFKKNSITEVTSERYGWTYKSYVPHEVIYKIPFRLRIITIIMLALSFLMGLALMYYVNKRNFSNIKNIVSIIESAEREQPLPPVPSRVEDEYGYIVQTMIKTFIERSFLKIQLSERMYKSRTIELLALQSQINPHFLFNTLETINWKVLGFTKRPNEANEMISNLSDILKYTLESEDREVFVRDEIRYTQSYIMIQKVRYRDKFDVVWKYGEDVLHCRTMKLLLQPLIENSIYHGIKEKEGKGTIEIEILSVGSGVEMIVRDDGLGIPPERLSEIRRKLETDGEFSAHIGLYNTNKRLRLQYGEESGISIDSAEGESTTVRALIKPVES